MSIGTPMKVCNRHDVSLIKVHIERIFRVRARAQASAPRRIDHAVEEPRGRHCPGNVGERQGVASPAVVEQHPPHLCAAPLHRSPPGPMQPDLAPSCKRAACPLRLTALSPSQYPVCHRLPKGVLRGWRLHGMRVNRRTTNHAIARHRPYHAADWCACVSSSRSRRISLPIDDSFWRIACLFLSQN